MRISGTEPSSYMYMHTRAMHKCCSMGTNCAPLIADIFLYSYEADFIQSLLSTRRKQLTSRFNFTYRYIDDVLSINNPEFENYLGQTYPVELETWTLPFITNVTISISTSQIVLSWVAIFQPRPPIAILQFIRYARACSSYGCFILRATRLSNKLLRDTSSNAWNRHSGSFMVDTGILFNNMKFPFYDCLMTSCDLTICNDNPLLIRLCTELDLLLEHLRRMWHANRGRLLLRTPGPVLFGLAYVLLIETNPFSELVVTFPDYTLRLSLGTFSILHIFFVLIKLTYNFHKSYFVRFAFYILLFNYIPHRKTRTITLHAKHIWRLLIVNIFRS